MDWLAEDDGTEDVKQYQGSWKIVIVDDDNEVHKVTSLALADFEFESKSLELISVHSGIEAQQLLKERNDIAVILLDVVMESEDAGLQVIKYIREKLENHFTRIILRTGQPGFAPINDIIRDYDIDGYLAKTEIFKHTLNHSFYIALRSYRDVLNIQNYQKGLESIIHGINNLNQIDEVISLSKAIITQLNQVLCSEKTECIIKGTDVFTMSQSEDNCLRLMNDQGQCESVPSNNEVNEQYLTIGQTALSEERNVSSPPYYAYYYQSTQGSKTVFILKSDLELSKNNKKLLHVFSVHILQSLEKLLSKDVESNDG